MSIEKRFSAYLLINWKTGEMRLRKTPFEDVSGYWVPLDLDITLVVPERQPAVALRIEMSEARVEQIVASELGLLPEKVEE